MFILLPFMKSTILFIFLEFNFIYLNSVYHITMQPCSRLYYLPCRDVPSWCYKKVLLRERKRHTAHWVVSAHSAVCLGEGGTSVPAEGVTPVLFWSGGIPVLGYPPPPVGTGVHPPPGQDWGTPRKDLGPETWERTWDWGTPLRVWTDRHLWKQYLPHPLHAGGNYE